LDTQREASELARRVGRWVSVIYATTEPADGLGVI
jgi:hypothetical protein